MECTRKLFWLTLVLLTANCQTQGVEVRVVVEDAQAEKPSGSLNEKQVAYSVDRRVGPDYSDQDAEGETISTESKSKISDGSSPAFTAAPAVRSAEDGRRRKHTARRAGVEETSMPTNPIFGSNNPDFPEPITQAVLNGPVEAAPNPYEVAIVYPTNSNSGLLDSGDQSLQYKQYETTNINKYAPPVVEANSHYMQSNKRVAGPKKRSGGRKAAALETDDWLVYWDRGTWRWYYVHKHTGHSSWEKPAALRYIALKPPYLKKRARKIFRASIPLGTVAPPREARGQPSYTVVPPREARDNNSEDNRRSSELIPGDVRDVSLGKKRRMKAKIYKGANVNQLQQPQSDPASKYTKHRDPASKERVKYISYMENIAAPYKKVRRPVYPPPPSQERRSYSTPLPSTTPPTPPPTAPPLPPATSRQIPTPVTSTFSGYRHPGYVRSEVNWQQNTVMPLQPSTRRESSGTEKYILNEVEDIPPASIIKGTSIKDILQNLDAPRPPTPPKRYSFPPFVKVVGNGKEIPPIKLWPDSSYVEPTERSKPSWQVHRPANYDYSVSGYPGGHASQLKSGRYDDDFHRYYAEKRRYYAMRRKEELDGLRGPQKKETSFDPFKQTQSFLLSSVSKAITNVISGDDDTRRRDKRRNKLFSTIAENLTKSAAKYITKQILGTSDDEDKDNTDDKDNDNDDEDDDEKESKSKEYRYFR